MRFAVVCVLVALCVVPARCEDGEGVWTKMKNAVKKFVESMKDLMKEMKDEIHARTADIKDWSVEIFRSFQAKMKEWVEEVNASDSEKEDMRNYIERMKMPENEQ